MTANHDAAAIAAEEKQRRCENAQESVHSLAMEGLTVSDWQLVNIEQYVTGAIDMDELVRRGGAQRVRD
jgi:Antitoxin VbhA